MKTGAKIGLGARAWGKEKTKVETVKVEEPVVEKKAPKRKEKKHDE